MNKTSAIGLNIRQQATAQSPILGLLVRKSIIEVGEHSPDGKWARISRIIEGGIESASLDGAVPPGAVSGWVYLAELDPEPSPEAFDKVVNLTSPYLVKQGDVVGYLGEDVPARAKPIAGQPVSRKLLHMEVFSADDVPAYLSASRQWAKQHLPDKDQTLLLLRPGDALLDVPNGKVAYTINLAQVAPLAGTETKEVDGARWCKVTNPEFTGWIKEAAHLASPWEWPGFEVVDEPNSPSGAFWNDVAEKVGFIKREGPRPEKTPLYEALVKRLDANRDGKVSEQELDAALRNRTQAANIGRLIVRHDSEWAKVPATLQQEMARAIARYLGVDALKQVEEEMARAELLPWWDDVADGVEGFPVDPRVYHFHPAGLAGNYSKNKECDCIRYEVMYASRGPAYRDSQIESWSHYSKPIDQSSGRLAGISRRHGDASHEVQRQVIDVIVEVSKARGLEKDDLALVLAIARVESGFNPDAAAGTTSAAGLGQFVDGTAKHYGITTDDQRFSARAGADALVRHYLDNKSLAAKKYSGRELLVMIYAYHHDGPSLAYGGRQISEGEVMPKFDLFRANICEDVLS